MYKQIYDLTRSDLINEPIWFFPMDDSVEDELSVRPFQGNDAGENHSKVVVRANFLDRSGKSYVGYITWRGTNAVNEACPTVFIDDETTLQFWYGGFAPSKDDLNLAQQSFLVQMPVTYESWQGKGLSKIAGMVKGLYWLDEDDHISLVNIGVTS